MGDLNVRTGNKGKVHNFKLNEHLNHILPSSDEALRLQKDALMTLKQTHPAIP